MSATTWLYHFSEDPSIRYFVPHIPTTNPTQPASVWAIDDAHAPLYWFPRDCPRATVWATSPEQQRQLGREFATSAARLHAIEESWIERVRSCVLYVYRFDAALFTPWPEAEGQWVAHEAVEPIDVQQVGDPLECHRERGIELRVLGNLWPLVDQIVESKLPFSIVRIRNAAPRATRPNRLPETLDRAGP